MEYWLATSPWYGMILWGLLFISDYYLTLYSARGFREIGHFQFEGSPELTPQFQKDVDALNRVSKLHVTLLIAFSLVILLIWWLTKLLVYYFPSTYLFYLGMFLLVEVAVHFRHFRNISFIREIQKNGGVEGKIFYRKQFSYRVSAGELYMFSILFLLIAILYWSPMFLGGAFMCFSTGFKHSRLAKKASSISSSAVEVQA